MRAFARLLPAFAPLAALTALTFLTGCQDAPGPATPLTGDLQSSPAVHANGTESDISAAVGQGGTGTESATVLFGHHEAGSPFPPAVHDESFHAKDKIVPRNVSIDRNGSVTFEIGPLHQVAIFEPGTEPGDIDATQTEPLAILPPPLERITFDDGEVARSPGPGTSHTSWTTPAATFDAPGRYLVICTTNLHFLEGDMYAWVTVR